MQKTLNRIFLVLLSCVACVFIDLPVRFSGILPAYAGIKNFLPFTLGLFFGLYGIAGNILGCVISSLIAGTPANIIVRECYCIAVTGAVIFYGWHLRSKTHGIHFKDFRHYARYIMLIAAGSVLCFSIEYGAAYFVTGLFIALPVDILFGSLLCVQPVLPYWCKMKYDTSFTLDSGGANLDEANEEIEFAAMTKKIPMKRVFEIQSCLEELSMRIFHALPETKIFVSIQYGNVTSMRLNYAGKRYNPFFIGKGDDAIDVMSLKIIKHRALRASYFHMAGESNIHVVI